MNKIGEWFKRKFGKVNKEDVAKWSCIVGAGLLTLVGGIFEQRKKDQMYREELPKEVKRQAERLLKEMNKG